MDLRSRIYDSTGGCGSIVVKVILDFDQVTRTSPELALPLSKLTHNINGRTLSPDRFNVHRPPLHGGSSAILRSCDSPVVKVSDHDRHVMSSSPVPLKTRRVGKRCTLNLSRAETSSRWCGVVVRRGGTRSGVAYVT
ncbi:uncharacterized protein TNCV_1103311 [Trichonephila clavipes]|nr:uncharacterized protein TNCV_1103311 [Trichonephila clavipes]